VFFATERLRVTRFAPEDAATLARYRSDPAVARYQSWDAPVATADVIALIEASAHGDPRAAGWFQYKVERAEPPGLIGDLGVCRSDDGRQAELGFTFAPEHQGCGYATEAVRGMVRHLFEAEKLHRVSAGCDARNVRSARLLERVGFRREGHLVAATWIKGEWTDDLLFGLLAREWPAHRRGA
jgi:RimJ/RimL family protein N-acetyltransferase